MSTTYLPKSLVHRLGNFIILLFFFSSCSKKTETADFLRGQINGVAFECNTGFSATAGGAGEGQIFFKGSNAQYSFSFYLDGGGNDISAGNYVFTAGLMRNVSLYEGSDGYGTGQFFCIPACPFKGSGQIRIAAIDKKHVEGSFDFMTEINAGTGQSKTVTAGSFYIKRN